MKKYTFIYLAIATVFTLASCEKVIDVEVGNGETQLVVDAFLSNKKEAQKITLTTTGSFFSSGELAPATGATVKVSDGTNEYSFIDSNNNGEYVWTLSQDSLIELGKTYTLTINYNGFVYTSISKALPVPKIDSINYEYFPPQFNGNGTYLAELVARDLPGQPDYYWIKAYKNGVLRSGLDGLNISVDGSFSEESQNDGKLFIAPISTFASSSTEDSLGLGDTWKYEIWSISRSNLKFWQEIANQEIDGGIGALFSTPLANVRTNIESNSNEPKDKAVGWFNVSIVSSAEVVIVDNPNEKLSFSAN